MRRAFSCAGLFRLTANFSSSRQATLQAVAHWNAISAHIEKELGAALKKSPNIPLYVDALQATSFNQTVAGHEVALPRDNPQLAKCWRKAD